MQSDVGFVAQQTGNHQFCTVTDGVDGTVFDDNTLVADEQGLERSDDPPQVGFCKMAVRSAKHTEE